MRMSTCSLDDIIPTSPFDSGKETPDIEQRSFETDQEILLDPHCNPEKPQRISFHDVTSAAFLIKDDIEKTPCAVGLQTSNNNKCVIYPFLLASP